jgi:hypothetical protein
VPTRKSRPLQVFGLPAALADFIYWPVYILDLEMAILIGMMLTAVGVVLLGKVLKESIWSPMNSMKGGRKPKDRVIEIHEYEIVDEIENRASDGYKVEICD